MTKINQQKFSIKKMKRDKKNKVKIQIKKVSFLRTIRDEFKKKSYKSKTCFRGQNLYFIFFLFISNYYFFSKNYTSFSPRK